MGNKRLWDHSLVFHLLTGDIFTAGYHADGMDPCVCVAAYDFLWMFHRVWYPSPLYWCICTLIRTDAVKVIVHDASILCVQLRIHKVCVYIYIYTVIEPQRYSVTREGSGREREKKKKVRQRLREFVVQHVNERRKRTGRLTNLLIAGISMIHSCIHQITSALNNGQHWYSNSSQLL